MTIIRTKAQRAAMHIWQQTLAEVRADKLVRAACAREGGDLSISGDLYPLDAYETVHVLAAGKASCAMAQGVIDVLAGLTVRGLAVTKYGHALPLPQIDVVEAGHPVPDQRSIEAGARMLEAAQSASPRDLVLGLVSGGASALMESLVPGVTLDEVRDLTKGLLNAGADIGSLNTVRRCLSQIKAGGLARACGDAQIVVLLLSDVIGNSRDVIGSGPFWGSPPNPQHALDVLDRFRVEAPNSVQLAIRSLPHVQAAKPRHVVIGDIFTLLEAAQRSAERAGFRPKVFGRPFSGEARVVGALLAAEAIGLGAADSTYDCLISAGETTVTVKGSGKGGRSQELACAAALAIEDVPDLAFLCAGTDGTDGPTDAAGGLVDGTTYQRTDLRRALEENDSTQALSEAGGLITTGPTQTNLNDLVIATRVTDA